MTPEERARLDQLWRTSRTSGGLREALASFTADGHTSRFGPVQVPPQAATVLTVGGATVHAYAIEGTELALERAPPEGATITLFTISR